eukprot:XP_016657209.1 PREDICTED: uncharacterized protein LOC107882798 [Acyrthosiphon pisum]
MLRLFNYYERYWLQNVGVKVLSVYKKKFRTNNNVESFHNKLRQMFQTSHPNIWVFLGNICKLIDNYSIKLNQTDNGLVILNTKRAKYVANDKRIRSASRRLRQGLITVRTFLKLCSYSVAGYEERMRGLAIGQIHNEAVENQVNQERRNIIDVSDDEVDIDQETAADMNDEAVENHVNQERRNIFDVSDDEVDIDQETAADMNDDQMVNIQQDESGNQQDWNEEDFIIEEELDPDIIRMMETDNRIRMLEIENIPFVQVPSVLPPITNSDQMCVVCTVSEKTHAFIPCGHIAVCGDCLVIHI